MLDKSFFRASRSPSSIVSIPIKQRFASRSSSSSDNVPVLPFAVSVSVDDAVSTCPPSKRRSCKDHVGLGNSTAVALTTVVVAVVAVVVVDDESALNRFGPKGTIEGVTNRGRKPDKDLLNDRWNGLKLIGNDKT